MKAKLLLAILMLQFVLGYAQPGAIDLTFNPTGVGAYGGSLPPTYQPTANGLVYKSRIYPSGPYKDQMIIIGRFTSFNGTPRRYVARLFPNGTVDTSFNSPAFTSGYLYCVNILPNDKILVAGVFTIASGATTIRNIARLNPDGSIDHTFNPAASGSRGSNGEIHALTMQDDGKILIGGTFTIWNDLSSRRLIRLNADGTLDPTFDGIGTINGEVRTIVVQKLGANANKIVAGGFFTGFTGYSKLKLLRLMPNGDYDPTFNVGGTGASGGDAVFDISLADDDQMLVGGKFTHYNGVNKRSIFMVDANGALVTTWNAGGIGVTNIETNIEPGSGYNIFTIKRQPNGEVLIGGNFTAYNGTVIPKGLARLNVDGTLDTTFLTGTGFTGGTNVYQGKSVIRDLILQRDGKIIASGDFTDYDGTPRRMLARIKTRNCSETAIFNSVNGWENGEMPTSIAHLAIIESGSYTIPSGTHLIACELEINQGATLIVAPDASITVEGRIVTNGIFTVESSGNLVQIKDDALNTQATTGYFTMRRNTTPMTRYDYTYWSSPVVQPTLFNISPNTLWDKYFKFSTAINNWQTILNGSEIMTTGRGYIIRAPQSFSITNPTIYTANFIGIPNNGKFLVPVALGTTANWNLLGNPYPCAFDADKFLNHPDNTSKVNGTIYLWTHNTEIANNGSGQYVYTTDDYAAYNAMGGVSTTPTGLTPFTGKVASGQAFFIEGLQSGNVTFNNSMRTASDNRQFYRLADVDALATPSQPLEKHRIWLNLSNGQQAFNQTLIGYASGATTGIDRNFDGKVFGGNAVTLYSISDQQNLTIQGRPLPFNPTDQVTLGYKTTIAGNLQISLANFDGLFDSQSVLLEDKLLNKIHNLKKAPYKFSTAVGTFNDRFVLRYSAPAVSTSNLAAAPNLRVKSESDGIAILSEGQIMKSVTIFDATGKQVFYKDQVHAADYLVSSVQKNNELLLINITLEDDTTTVKKIVY
ncbi:MAG TPA: hypothetical protein VGB44_02695 [Flavobacterium sp.]|jgi:uncharacterized delta-60 repeat protein